MANDGMIRGLGPGGRHGLIDYRLARRNLLAALRAGRVDRLDVCDAHPELIRAATHHGAEADDPCPVCDAEELVLLRYVFGSRLPKGGRLVVDDAELAKVARGRSRLLVYEVEICRSCHWNHLARSIPIELDEQPVASSRRAAGSQQ